MKKVLLAVDGTNFSAGAFDFVCKLNEKEPLLLTGVFVPQLDYADLWNYPVAVGAGAVYVPLTANDAPDEALARQVALFEKSCQRRGIPYRVHADAEDYALPELKRESRFADVMIVGGESFYRNVAGINRTNFLTGLLHHAECPVMVVPEAAPFPQTNLLAYDGSEASVYAVKQFAYLFPHLAANKTVLVYAEEEGNRDFPYRNEIVELVNQHYPDLALYKLPHKRYFNVWLSEHKGALLVCGSFGRSALSQALRKSFAADAVQAHKLPVFIAHK